MAFNINHIHLKAPDPSTTAEWYVKAFNFQIISDELRSYGDRYVRCVAENGVRVIISGARPGQRLERGDAGVHVGFEHFGLDTEDIEEDIKRLEGLGAKLLEGPIDLAAGKRICYLQVPDDVRVELIQQGPVQRPR